VKVEANCIKAVEETVKTLGRIDILFNNAAQQLENHDILTLDSKQWEDTFAVNIHPYFYFAKAVIPHMQPGSAIVNNASINAYIGRPDLLDYTCKFLPFALQLCTTEQLPFSDQGSNRFFHSWSFKSNCGQQTD